MLSQNVLGVPLNRTLWESHLRNSWIKLEWHTTVCCCSYCRTQKRVIGLWLPQNKSWNSWRVLFLQCGAGTLYFRWTLPNPLMSD